MSHLTHPAALLLLLAIPPLVWWWIRQRRAALRHPFAGGMPSLPNGRGRFALWGGAGLRALGLTSLVVALAGPRWPDERTRIDTEGIAILMLVDVSGSMGELDFDWQGAPISRLEAVKRVFRLFIAGGAVADQTADGAAAPAFQGRPTDLIGLVAFARRPETSCPLTLSHSALLRVLAEEQPRSVPGESETNISDAIVMGVHRLQSAGARRKVLVLLSDGEHNVPRPQSGWTPRQAAHVAASLDIPMYTIDAGGTLGGREPGVGESVSPAVRRAEASRALQELASITRAKSFPAHDTAELVKACQAIDALERADIQSFQYRKYHEGYPWFALASFVCFVVVLCLEGTVWRRLP